MNEPTGNDQLARLAEAAGYETAATATYEATVPMLIIRTARRWLAFKTNTVGEIVLKGQVTSVPAGPHHVLGVTLIRGRLVPVISLEEMLGLGPSTEMVATLPRLVVLQGTDLEVAVVADEIRGIMDVPLARAIDHASQTPGLSFVTGEIELAEKLVCLIDTEMLLEATIAGRVDR